MCAKTFRHGYWTPALRAANIHANPHLARHWFVTNALRMIEKTSKDENEAARRKAELVEYMGWRTAERTLKAYEHVNPGRQLRRDHADDHPWSNEEARGRNQERPRSAIAVSACGTA